MGGTCGLGIGDRNWELGTIRGTRRTAYHFQFVIVFIFVFVWIFFRCFSLYTPRPPESPLQWQYGSVTCCPFAAFAFALHVICMTKEQEKMSEMSCQLTTRANQYKNNSNNKWQDYQIPIRDWTVDRTSEVWKILIESKSFFSLLNKINSICFGYCSINVLCIITFLRNTSINNNHNFNISFLSVYSQH